MELRMKDDNRHLTNPICHGVDYKSQLLKVLPDITILDGMFAIMYHCCLQKEWIFSFALCQVRMIHLSERFTRTVIQK